MRELQLNYESSNYGVAIVGRSSAGSSFADRCNITIVLSPVQCVWGDDSVMINMTLNPSNIMKYFRFYTTD